MQTLKTNYRKNKVLFFPAGRNKFLAFTLIGVVLTAFALFGLSSCGKGRNGEIYEKPVIAVGIPPVETLVKEISGGNFNTILLIPPGYSPENYEPTPLVMEKLGRAAVYFSTGTPAETTAIIPKLKDKKKVIELEKYVSGFYGELSFGSFGRDPHIWLSPKRVIKMVGCIAAELSSLDPQNGEVYASNAEKYIARLNKLDGEIQNLFKDIPEGKRTFIVFHPSLGYFADDYGLKMEALEEEGKEATPSRLKEMIDLAKQKNIKTVFYQAEVDAAQSRAFAEEIGGKAVKVSPLSPDYINNLLEMAGLIADSMR